MNETMRESRPDDGNQAGAAMGRLSLLNLSSAAIGAPEESFAVR